MWVGFFPIINHPFGVPPFMETPIYDYRCLRPAFVCKSTTSTDWWRTVVKVEKDEPNLVKVEYHHAEPDLQLFSCEKKGVFMSLDSMDLELVWTCDWYAAYAICSIYQHHPTSIIYIHVPRATFLPYGSYGGLGELALSAIAGPKAYPNTWNWMDRQPRDIGESSPVRCCKMESFSNRIGWQMTYIYQPLLCKTRVLLFALCSQSTSI